MMRVALARRSSCINSRRLQLRLICMAFATIDPGELQSSRYGQLITPAVLTYLLPDNGDDIVGWMTMAARDQGRSNCGRHLHLEIEGPFCSLSASGCVRLVAAFALWVFWINSASAAAAANADPKIARRAPRFERRRLSAAHRCGLTGSPARPRKVEPPLASSPSSSIAFVRDAQGARQSGRRFDVADVMMVGNAVRRRPL
jgi:hypothetical protein